MKQINRLLKIRYRYVLNFSLNVHKVHIRSKIFLSDQKVYSRSVTRFYLQKPSFWFCMSSFFVMLATSGADVRRPGTGQSSHGQVHVGQPSVPVPGR